MERTDLESAICLRINLYMQNTDLNYRLLIKDREASILPASLDIFILCNSNY